MNQLKKGKKYLANYARYSSIAFQMLAIILVGVFGGIKLDEWIETGFPIFTVALSFLAVIVAILAVVKEFIWPPKKTGNKNDKL
jgi:F0F1-type ATP synthase assembly protein I